MSRRNTVSLGPQSTEKRRARARQGGNEVNTLQPWLDADFPVPAGIETADLKLRMLGMEHNQRDYEAVMETQDRLRRGSVKGWPRESFTLEENRRDLEHHQREFIACEAFAYTVLSLDESRVLGCVYLNPSQTLDKDVDVYLWVRESEIHRGLAQILQRTVAR